jgi:predicted phosphodiesterase
LSDIHFLKRNYTFSKSLQYIDISNIEFAVYCGDILRNGYIDGKVTKFVQTFFQRLLKLFDNNVDKIYIILGNNDCFELNFLKQYGRLIYGNYATKIKRHYILFSSYSETGTNTFAQDISLPTDLDKFDIIITHGTFSAMQRLGNKIFIFGHHHISTKDASKFYFFKYKTKQNTTNICINVSLSNKILLNDRQPRISLICIKDFNNVRVKELTNSNKLTNVHMKEYKNSSLLKNVNEYNDTLLI